MEAVRNLLEACEMMPYGRVCIQAGADWGSDTEGREDEPECGKAGKWKRFP